MAKEAPKPDKDEKVPAETAPAAKGQLGRLLLWAGYLVLTTTVTVAVAVFVAQRRRAAQWAAAPPAADSLRTGHAAEGADSLGAADSLALTPEDSLKTHIQDLQAKVRQGEDSLHKATDTTRRLQTRLERLEAELDTLRQRDVMLSSAEVARLSRVFGSMQPRKAAPVMLRMDNASVAAILLMIEERTAAKIMAAMPPDRAAGISTLIREQAGEKARRVRAGS